MYRSLEASTSASPLSSEFKALNSKYRHLSAHVDRPCSTSKVRIRGGRRCLFLFVLFYLFFLFGSIWSAKLHYAAPPWHGKESHEKAFGRDEKREDNLQAQRDRSDSIVYY